MQRIVIDSSVLVEGFAFSATKNFEYYATNSVIEELESKLGDEKVEALRIMGLNVAQPSEFNVTKVEEIASAIGETPRLSEADIDILALAIEIGAAILTDDYSIQNVAKELGIKYIAFAQRGITKKILWKYRCTGCNKYFQNFLTICPICGLRVKTVR
ncbi:MAG: PIN domain-containing protein [Candidatus Thermoplasmatota archaeon]|nr:PIN domain-containing protein [Candidatus Thermoplasmatota archaeon]